MLRLQQVTVCQCTAAQEPYELLLTCSCYLRCRSTVDGVSQASLATAKHSENWWKLQPKSTNCFKILAPAKFHTWWYIKTRRRRRACVSCEQRRQSYQRRVCEGFQIIGQNSAACGSRASRAGYLQLHRRLLSAPYTYRGARHKAGLLMH